MAYTVFISHSMRKEDVSLLSRILENTALLGVACYMAQHDGQAGRSIEAKLRQQIISCKCLLALITKNSIKSDWVQWEVGVAASQGKLVIPILQKGIVLPPFLAGKEYIEFDPQDPEKTVEAVTGYLHKLKLADDNQKAIAFAVVGGLGLLLLLGSKK